MWGPSRARLYNFSTFISIAIMILVLLAAGPVEGAVGYLVNGALFHLEFTAHGYRKKHLLKDL